MSVQDTGRFPDYFMHDDAKRAFVGPNRAFVGRVPPHKAAHRGSDVRELRVYSKRNGYSAMREILWHLFDKYPIDASRHKELASSKPSLKRCGVHMETNGA